MSAPIDEAVQRIFADIFGVPVESIQPDSSPETIETWDSMAHLNLVLALEQEFQVQFAPEEIELLVSPEKVAVMVGEKLAVLESK